MWYFLDLDVFTNVLTNCPVKVEYLRSQNASLLHKLQDVGVEWDEGVQQIFFYIERDFFFLSLIYFRFRRGT